MNRTHKTLLLWCSDVRSSVSYRQAETHFSSPYGRPCKHGVRENACNLTDIKLTHCIVFKAINSKRGNTNSFVTFHSLDWYLWFLLDIHDGHQGGHRTQHERLQSYFQDKSFLPSSNLWNYFWQLLVWTCCWRPFLRLIRCKGVQPSGKEDSSSDERSTKTSFVIYLFIKQYLPKL